MRLCSGFLFGLFLLPLAVTGATYTNPVVPRDFPDPSVIRVGDMYWATATASRWAPRFPLLKSTDLIHWERAGEVFAKAPDWAASNFWAPELQTWKGKFYIYYTARSHAGTLSVAVAVADAPQGPYTDKGVIVSQEVGSIDAVAVDDETGQRYLIWKDDGNSRGQPTFLWAAKLNQDGTRLAGPHFALFRNDQPWEGGLVEGPFLVKRDGWLYLFYSGNGCCGAGCTYALGVARSKKLLGPWEKYDANPILAANPDWRCPGHGSIVQDKAGRHWLLYHAYSARNSSEKGRQGLLDEVTWGTNGWPVINQGHGPSTRAAGPPSEP
jgi:beta-xylosidase